MTTIHDIDSIVDCAIAGDGGSIWIRLADTAGHQLEFTINRAVTSRGTDSFNRVSGEAGQLDLQAASILLAKLQEIHSTTDSSNECHKLLSTFIGHLHNAQPA